MKKTTCNPLLKRVINSYILRVYSRRIIATGFSLLFFTIIRAQSLSPTVIASSGNTGTTANCIVDWSVGEIAIETLTQSSVILTQGFHQNFAGYPDAIELLDNVAFGFFPNPVRDKLFIVIKPSVNGKYMVELFNNKGIKVIHTLLRPDNNNQELDISRLPAGIYMLKISAENGKTLKTDKFVKL
jgi:hypothetical protein